MGSDMILADLQLGKRFWNADENVLVDLGAEIANEDRVLGTTVVAAAVGKTTTRGPVELEGAVRVGDESAVELESLGGSVGRFKVDEAISSITSSRVWLEITFFLLRVQATHPENLSRIILTLTW